jgi:putative hemolysin
MSDFILDGEGISFGDIRVRLAQNENEIKAAQHLRYKIFYEEFSAKPNEEIAAQERDFDHFDDFADHLVVVDTTIADKNKAIVGTYRLLRQEKAKQAGRFYTEDEFNISKLTENYSGLLEMGRSCVYPDYRTKAVLQLLWQGIAEYVGYYDCKFLFGCASFHGSKPDEHAEGLSYLYHNHLAPEEFRPRAHDNVYTKMNWMAAEQIDAKKVVRILPPLIKGYLRIGGFVGDGAFIDYDFDTTDVCVVLSTSHLTKNYQKHYERKTGFEFGKNE